MVNKKMQEMVEMKFAIDLKNAEKTDDGCYVVTNFIEDTDYCDTSIEAWIWSIGKNKTTGVIYAARDGRFYERPNYECLWLR